METARHQFSILKQICELIPSHLVPKLAREHGVEKKCRTFDPWSHVVSLLHVQIAHSMSLNDACDTLRNHGGVLLEHLGRTSRGSHVIFLPELIQNGN